MFSSEVRSWWKALRCVEWRRTGASASPGQKGGRSPNIVFDFYFMEVRLNSCSAWQRKTGIVRRIFLRARTAKRQNTHWHSWRDRSNNSLQEIESQERLRASSREAEGRCSSVFTRFRVCPKGSSRGKEPGKRSSRTCCPDQDPEDSNRGSSWIHVGPEKKSCSRGFETQCKPVDHRVYSKRTAI